MDSKSASQPVQNSGGFVSMRMSAFLLGFKIPVFGSVSTRTHQHACIDFACETTWKGVAQILISQRCAGLFLSYFHKRHTDTTSLWAGADGIS